MSLSALHSDLPPLNRGCGRRGWGRGGPEAGMGDAWKGDIIIIVAIITAGTTHWVLPVLGCVLG